MLIFTSKDIYWTAYYTKEGTFQNLRSAKNLTSLVVALMLLATSPIWIAQCGSPHW